MEEKRDMSKKSISPEYQETIINSIVCLLYTSDAADE